MSETFEHSITDMPVVTVESVMRLRERAIKLQKENVELKARLDKWESQAPVAWLDEENDVFRYCPPENLLLQPCAPLFTRPKETDNSSR